MRTIVRLILVALLVALIAATGYLLHGPLFAWSPVTPGFARSHEGRIEFLHRADRPVARARRLPERDLAQIESAFGLTFGDKVTIVICDNWEDVERFTPWLPAEKSLAARTLEFGTLVYLTPTAQERTDTAEFLRHELVHVLLLRHTPYSARTALKRHWWPMEGMAVRYGNPAAYPPPDQDRVAEVAETLPSVLQQGLTTDGETTIAERYAFAGGLVAYLEQVYSRPLLHQFLFEYLRQPDSWSTTFEKVFEEPFDSVVGAYARSTQDGFDPDAEPQTPIDPDDPEWNPSAAEIDALERELTPPLNSTPIAPLNATPPAAPRNVSPGSPGNASPKRPR
jgi:hypothetical protein